DLWGAYLSGAYLSDADLWDADLWGTYLRYADLRGVVLKDADLMGAVLWGTENLSNQQIKSTCSWEKAIYTDAEWNKAKGKWIAVDEKANQKKIEEIKQDKASDPENFPNCSRWQ
ncbi:MAG: pentapeptide repeat-containing protein, partial [Waterburya sp.]